MWVFHMTCRFSRVPVGRLVHLRQDPREAILVIFVRRVLIFFLFESSWKMKKDTTFVRMASGDHLEDAKLSKKGTSLRRI